MGNAERARIIQRATLGRRSGEPMEVVATVIDSNRPPVAPAVVADQRRKEPRRARIERARLERQAVESGASFGTPQHLLAMRMPK